MNSRVSSSYFLLPSRKMKVVAVLSKRAMAQAAQAHVVALGAADKRCCKFTGVKTALRLAVYRSAASSVMPVILKSLKVPAEIQAQVKSRAACRIVSHGWPDG